MQFLNKGEKILMKKVLGILITAVAVVALVGCGKVTTTTVKGGTTTTESNTSAETKTEVKRDADTLVVSYADFSEKFSPFFADSAYDVDVYSMTQVSLLSATNLGQIITKTVPGEDGKTKDGDDPSGSIITDAGYTVDGQTYKGIATVDIKNIGKENAEDTEDNYLYTFNLRQGVKFSDGVELTADDVLFSIYVLCDTAYDGSSTLYSVPIKGITGYQLGTTSEALAEKSASVYKAIYAAYAGTYMALSSAYTVKDTDVFTQAQYDEVAGVFDKGNVALASSIAEYVHANYYDYYASSCGPLTKESDWALSPVQMVFGMLLWGFGSWEEAEDSTAEAVKYTGKYKGVSGALYDPMTFTAEMAAAEMLVKYEGDVESMVETEKVSGSNYATAEAITWKAQYVKDNLESSGAKVAYAISGVKKLGKYSLSIETTEFSATSIYQFALSVAPLHYYGSTSNFKCEGSEEISDSSLKFGFTKGDLSAVKSKTTKPLGAGPYKFVQYSNGVVYFDANESYFSGAPKTAHVQFREGQESEFVTVVSTGLAEISSPSYSKSAAKTIASYNSNNKTTGDVLTTALVDFNGYGYIGLNAKTILVGKDPASQASKNLRKALTTILAVYRDEVVESYYGSAASVIQYPVSNSSWAAPQSTDAGYQVAYSVSVDGKAIYTSTMTNNEKYVAALAASKAYFEAAGYKFTASADGKSYTAVAPEDAKTEYTAIIPGGGSGDHPSYQILVFAKTALATLGITLTINDPSDSNVLWDALDADTQEIWCAAWQSTVDPDMYQVYHSQNVVSPADASKPSSGSNHYNIVDSHLDDLIIAGRKSADNSERKVIYKECFDTILDWAVEIPVYQRKTCYLFSTERVVADSLPKTITPYWNWLSEVDQIRVNIVA